MISVYVVILKIEDPVGCTKLVELDCFTSLVEASGFLLGYQAGTRQKEMMIRFDDRQTEDTFKDMKAKIRQRNSQ